MWCRTTIPGRNVQCCHVTKMLAIRMLEKTNPSAQMWTWNCQNVTEILLHHNTWVARAWMWHSMLPWTENRLKARRGLDTQPPRRISRPGSCELTFVPQQTSGIKVLLWQRRRRRLLNFQHWRWFFKTFIRHDFAPAALTRHSAVVCLPDKHGL